MNTPAHVAASLLVWRNEAGWPGASAVLLGAVLPDAPMFGFYAYQRLVAASSEREIWSKLYFQDGWQLFFDVFNSIPLLLVVIGVSYFCGFRWGVLLAASALLHVVCDLPLHHDDAHRHFLPLSNWRLASPISYWDPRHYGFIFMWFELAFTIGACLYVATRGGHWPIRSIALATLGLYALGIIFALVVWLPQLLNSSAQQPPGP